MRKSPGRVRDRLARLALLGLGVAGVVLAGWWWQHRPSQGPENRIVDTDAVQPGEPEGSAAAPNAGAGAVPRPQAEAAALKLEAVAVAKQVAEAYPDDALSHALLGSAHYNTGQSEEAIRQLRRCLELNPDQADAYEILARIAYEKGELEESIRLGEEARQRGGVNTDVLNQLGRAWLDLGRADEAQKALEQATRLPRPRSETHYLLGQAQLQSGDYAEAKASFRRAIALMPNHTQAFFGLFTACLRLGQAEEAAQYRERFLELEGVDRLTLTDRSAREDVLSGLPMVRQTVARTFFGAAQIYGSHKQEAKAAEFLVKAALLDEEAPGYRATLEAMFVRRNAAAHGVRLFEQLAAAQPQNGLNHYFLGRLHERLEQVEAAETAFRRVQQMAPAWAEGYSVLAELYLRRNVKPAEARELARRAVELEPSAHHYYLLAVACSRTHERAEALAAIERAVALDPAEPRYGALLEQLRGGP